jgi:hypothetical protein
MEICVWISRMAPVVMATLTKKGYPPDQKPAMVAPVNLVAGKAILRNGGMLEGIRPPLFSMAFVAEFVDRICLDHRLQVRGAHRVVTARALDLALSNRMMRLFVGLSPDIPVASETEVRLFSLEEILALYRRVDGMAVVARDLG